MAQALKDVQTSDTPLVLKAQGSFFIGGDKVEQTRSEVGDLAPGGHIAVDTPTGLAALPTWQARFEACQAMIGRIKDAGGQAEMLAPPDRGIRGNSHMIMQDKNNLQIADLVLQWIRSLRR